MLAIDHMHRFEAAFALAALKRIQSERYISR